MEANAFFLIVVYLASAGTYFLDPGLFPSTNLLSNNANNSVSNFLPQRGAPLSYQLVELPFKGLKIGF